jgi:hypothetical protein
MDSCYGCAYLCQSGAGDNACLRYDPYEEGGAQLGDMPTPFYEDCYAIASEGRSPRGGAKRISAR